MKKKIFTVITAAVCAFGAVPAMTSSGVSVDPTASVSCLKGDANLDTKASLADSVAILQHIANRDKYGLSAQGLVNADVDGVAGVTANDALALQRQDSEHNDWQWHSAPDKALFTSSIDYTMGHEGFKDDIDIWGTIKGGYAGVITNTYELTAYLSKICTDEKIADYTTKYGDEFFAQNVLFLNTVSQSMSAQPCLVIDSVDVGGDITVNAVWDYPEVGEAVMSVIIGAVEFSKDAYKGQQVIWTCNKNSKNTSVYESDGLYSARVDYTMGYKGFKDGMDNPKINRKGYGGVITSTDELTAYLSEVCTDEKIAEYIAKYDTAFFKNKVLLMNVIEQYQGAQPCLFIDSIDFGDTVTVNAVWNYLECGADIMSVCVGVVELDKEAYKGQPVVWTFNDASAAPARTKFLSSSARTDWYYDTGSDMKPEVWDMLEKRNYSAVITSSAELEEYLSKLFQKDVVTKQLKFYEGYFEHCVILMNCQLQTSGGSCRLNVKSTEFSDDSSVINVKSAWDYSDADVDMLSVCLQQVKVQKEDYDGQTVNWITLADMT